MMPCLHLLDRRWGGSFRLVLLLVSVVLIRFCLTPVAPHWLPFLAVAPFVLSLRGVGPLAGLSLGWLYGFSIWISAIWWVPTGFETMLGWPVAAARATGIFLCVYQGLPYALYGLFCGWSHRRGLSSGPLFHALLLTLLIYLRPVLIPGSPAVTLHAWPLAIQTADLGGADMVCLFLLVVNFLTADIIVHLRNTRAVLVKLAVVTVIVASLLGYGAWRLDHFHTLEETAPPGEFVSIASMQPNLPIRGFDGMDRSGPYAGVLGTMVKITDKSVTDFVDTDLVVWPEVPRGIDCDCDDFTNSGVARIAGQVGAPVMLDCIERDYGDNKQVTTTRRGRDGLEVSVTTRKIAAMYSAVWLISPERCGPAYRKVKLIPFGERTPLRDIWPWLKKRVGRELEYSPGDGPSLITLRGDIHIQPLICYESAFPSLTRRGVDMGADAFVNVSDDAWFVTAQASKLHLATALFRTVEMRRPLVSCTNSGFGAHIAATGEIIPQTLTPMYVSTARQARLHCPREESIYSRGGYLWFWPAWLFVLIRLILVRFHGFSNKDWVNERG